MINLSYEEKYYTLSDLRGRIGKAA